MVLDSTSNNNENTIDTTKITTNEKDITDKNCKLKNAGISTKNSIS